MGKSQLFEARSQMPVDAEAVFAWHAREGAFERLQPPWESVEVVERQGEGVREGVRVVVRVKVGPVPMHLVARHTRCVPGSLFQDVQEEGPFSKWVHTHRMWDEPTGGTVLEDEVEYVLPVGALGRVFGDKNELHLAAPEAQERVLDILSRLPSDAISFFNGPLPCCQTPRTTVLRGCGAANSKRSSL